MSGGGGTGLHQVGHTDGQWTAARQVCSAHTPQWGGGGDEALGWLGKDSRGKESKACSSSKPVGRIALRVQCAKVSCPGGGAVWGGRQSIGPAMAHHLIRTTQARGRTSLPFGGFENHGPQRTGGQGNVVPSHLRRGKSRWRKFRRSPWISCGKFSDTPRNGVVCRALHAQWSVATGASHNSGETYLLHSATNEGQIGFRS